ncbi:hypothetical protein EW145_g6642 [Phellinidium pouzarii]|uniref:AAA-ATPase-like domain-containing protein n=1 Tax=Phellinidium pouzarii TaxID=167371 RepID=A0A4S4KW07_9AGAM|nr:hypothetical protein EW145_g6642 [Phellinidium pouzarii]
MPSQRSSPCIPHSYSPYPHHHSANINHLCDILNDPDLRPAIDNLIDQPKNQAIQIPLYIHDTLLFNIHALRQQRRILAKIIDTHSASLQAFPDVLSQFFEDVPTDISSDSSPPPIAIPNPETHPSGSPENPISIVDDSEDQFIEVSETAIQTSPTLSQSANHEHGSADRDTQVVQSAYRRIWVIVGMDCSENLGRVNVILKGDRFSSALSDFRDRATSCTLVDKTQGIADFLSVKRPLHCVLRPRRSGKTTMLTMFRAFFEAGSTQDDHQRREMFKDLNLKICDHSSFQIHFAQYTVLYVDFSNLRGSSDEKHFNRVFTMQLNVEIRRHERMGHFVNITKPADLELIDDMKYPDNTKNVVLEKALYNLSRILYEATGRKILVLVDEYDTPVSSARKPEVYVYAEKFLRQTFSTLLRKTRYIFGALFVGILRCQRTSFLSGIPSLKIFPLVSTESLYDDTCLFTENEVQILFNHVKASLNASHSHLKYSFEDLKLWYESYWGAGRRLYNPWAVCRAFETQNLASYWHESGPGHFLIDHIFSARQQFQESLSRVLSSNPVRLTIRSRLYPISYGKFTPSDIFGLLFYAGYLTESKPNMYEIPNGEVRKAYTLWIARHMKSYPDFSNIRSGILPVVDAALVGSITIFRTRFRKFLESESLITVSRRNVGGMNTIMILGAFMSAQRTSVGPTLLRSSAPEIMALSFYDESSKTASIIVLASKTSSTKSSIQKASRTLLSDTDFKALTSQLPHEISSLREFSIVISACDDDMLP